jgi:hypothetical protein
MKDGQRVENGWKPQVYIYYRQLQNERVRSGHKGAA